MKYRQNFHNGSSAPGVDIKLHGLVNQGATCYLNSVLQVLFMTKSFREAAERHTCDNPHSECMDCHLKSLFDDLNRQTARPTGITKMLGINTVWEQRDAAEYFEKILSMTSPEASQIFHGQLAHKTTCSGCRTEKNAEGQFWHLPLEWVHSRTGEVYSVVDGTEEYFRESHYSGENQMYCDQCDAKSDATIKCVVQHHPESLMLLLKRFEFDYRYMTYVKNNRVVDVPCTLQIPENQTYELYAFVEHFGELRGGHYTATVKSQDDDLWYNFDDDRVTLLKGQLFARWNTNKFPSVYLLLYRKKKIDAADTCTQDVNNGGFPPAARENYDQCEGAEKIRGRGEGEETAEVRHDTTEAASIDRNKETAISNSVSVGSQYNHQESCDLCGRQDAHAKNCQGDGGTIIRGGKEEGSTGVDDQADETQPLPTETQHEERVEDQDCDPGRQHNVRQNNEGLDNVRNNINEDQEDREEDGHDYSVQAVSVDKEDEEKVKKDVKDAKEGKSAADGITGDLYQWPQDNGRVGDNEQTREERRDVEKDKEQKRGDDRQGQKKGISTTKPYRREGVEDKRQNRAEQKISYTHTRHGEVGVERQSNKQEEKGGNGNQRQDSSLRQKGLTGRGLRDGSVEKMRQGNSRPKESSGFTAGGRGDSKQSRLIVKIIEEESRETPSGTQIHTETNIIQIERKSDPIKEDETNVGPYLNDKKMRNMTYAQMGTAGIKNAMKKRHASSKKHREKKRNRKKLLGVFLCSRKKWKMQARVQSRKKK